MFIANTLAVLHRHWHPVLQARAVTGNSCRGNYSNLQDILCLLL